MPDCSEYLYIESRRASQQTRVFVVLENAKMDYLERASIWAAVLSRRFATIDSRPEDAINETR